MIRTRPIVSLLAVVALAVAGVAVGGAASASAVGNTLQVPGQYATIQAAVDAANPSGGTIIVQPGTYNESVVIVKNNITIKGAPNKPHPVLTQPGDPETGCNEGGGGSLDGFCIFPSGLDPVKNIEIANFTIEDFPGEGVFAYQGEGLNFHDNTISDIGGYGIVAFSSSHTQVVNNTISGGDEAGIYLGDSPNASALVRHNTVTDNAFGIFIRDASHGTVTENRATGNCFGIFLLAEGGSVVSDWTLVHNIADDNTRACPPNDEAPALSGGGIVVGGAAHARLTANHATGNQPSDGTLVSGGIVVFSTVCLGGSDPTYVQVDNNTVSGNLPGDIVYDGTGHHNTFYNNGAAVTTISPIACF